MYVNNVNILRIVCNKRCCAGKRPVIFTRVPVCDFDCKETKTRLGLGGVFDYVDRVTTVLSEVTTVGERVQELGVIMKRYYTIHEGRCSDPNRRTAS